MEGLCEQEVDGTMADVIFVPFHCRAELDETAAGHRSGSQALAIDGQRWVQTC